jgi:hypothetical protein
MVERKALQTVPSVARGRLRALLLAAIALLYVLSVPWYRPLDATPPTWLGLPSWVTTAVLCYFAAAVLNAIAWGLTSVPDAPPPDVATDEMRAASPAEPQESA